MLAGGGAAAFMLMGHSDPHKKVEAKKEPAKPPLYVALDPPFVANFGGDQVARFLQITVQILTREPETVEILKANDPVVRDNLLMLFSGQKYEVVAQPEGKEKLRQDALKSVRHVVETNGGKPDHHRERLFHQLRNAVTRRRIVSDDKILDQDEIDALIHGVDMGQ